MNLEIEAKISVSSLEPVSQRLKQIGSEFVKSVQETDTYLADAEGLLFKKGCGLRVRKQIGGSEKRFYLTYKGPRLAGRFKSRTETEIQISDYDTALNLFHELGFNPSIQVEKIRQIWKWESCLICLDELSKLGCFVEVEGPDEQQVAKTLEQLQLSDQPHISEGYAWLMRDAQNQHASEARNTKT